MTSASDAYYNAEKTALDTQKDASNLALQEIFDNGGIACDLNQFLLAIHGYGRTFDGFQRQQEVMLRDFYQSLEDRFGVNQGNKLIAIMSGSESDKRNQRILRIGRIARLSNENDIGPRMLSPLVYKLGESSAHGYTQGEVHVRVTDVVDVSELDEPNHGNRMADEIQIAEAVTPYEGFDELWLLASESTHSRHSRDLPTNHTWQYKVGVNKILRARSFKETLEWQTEGDAAYLSIIIKALQGIRDSQEQPMSTA